MIYMDCSGISITNVTYGNCHHYNSLVTLSIMGTFQITLLIVLFIYLITEKRSPR